MHLPSFAVSRGLEVFDGVMLVCITGIATFASRAMFQVSILIPDLIKQESLNHKCLDVIKVIYMADMT